MNASTTTLTRRVVALFDTWQREPAGDPAGEDRVEWARLWPFALMHLGCLAAVATGVSATAVWVCLGLYAARMFAITAFYHRYLSHRSFAAPRWVAFLGVLLAASSAQRGPLWWAAHHRRHHRHADEDGDAHSPHRTGFWWSHLGWFTTRRNFRTDLRAVPDLSRRPELVWLDRFDLAAPMLLIAALFAVGELLRATMPELGTSGLQLVVWGFCISTTLLFHVTSLVNSVGHLLGRRPYPTRDHSRNSLSLALLTFGEGWHNNHHWCPGSVRQGFRWWQVDLSFYLLWLLERLGLVRLRPLPQRVRRPR